MAIARQAITTTPQEALVLVQDGITLAIGGFNTAGKPMALVREIVRRGHKNLTVVAPPSTLDVDLLVATGCVKTLITPSVSVEVLAPIGPFYRRAVQDGAIEIKETDAGLLVTALKAARQGLPFLPWLGGVGTSIPELNPDLKLFDCPITGQKLIAVPAIKPDVALLHAAQSDPYGNIQHLGNPFADALIAQASKAAIVQVERLIPNEEVRQRPEQTTILSIYTTAVVPLPYGAHPFFSPRFYIIDKEHIREYLSAADAFFAGNKDPFHRYLDRYVYGPRTHEEYLAAVGNERLASLKE